VLNTHNIECFDKYYEINKNINLDNENPLNIENIKKELNELVDKEDYLLIRESGTEEVVRINIQTRKNDNYQMYNNYFMKMEIR
jgi:phosphomannomutase